MKKLLIVGALVCAFSGVSSAVTSCTSQPNWTLAQLEALNATGGCEIGDKIFAGFSGTFTGADASDTFAFQGPLPNGTTLNPFYNLNLNAGTAGILESGLSFGYTVAVDQTAVHTMYGATASGAIVRVTGGIQDNGNAGSAATLAKGVTVTTGTGSCPSGVSVSETSGNSTTTPCSGLNATLLTIAETFNYTGTAGQSSVTGFGNTFNQTITVPTQAPEPVSMFLFGTGLVAISILGRKRFLARK